MAGSLGGLPVPELGALIDVLNSGTEMVLVGVPAALAEAVAPVVWSRAAYIVPLAGVTSDADSLRAMLQEVLNRGRDAAMVTVAEAEAPGGAGSTRKPFTAEMLRRMIAEYCVAGDEIWAVVPETEMLQGKPVLMGRGMIELFLRGRKWSAADEILSANLAHVRTVRMDGAEAVVSDAGWKAPWDLPR
jgi:hypothetical protein